MGELAGVIFNTDGVLTRSATLHAAAWKRVFDALLLEQSRRCGERFRPFDLGSDYLRHMSGRSPGEGVRSFLTARDIELPEETPVDRPRAASVAVLAEHEEHYFREQLRHYGVAPFPRTVALIHLLRWHGIAVGAVSASRDCAAELRAAGVADLFDAHLGCAHTGDPGTDLFLEAARRLGTGPQRCTVVESRPAGVEAARCGGFTFVVGVDRTNRGGDLYRNGADVVVTDLSELEWREPEPGAVPQPPGERDGRSILEPNGS